jgi:hypothetical protein
MAEEKLPHPTEAHIHELANGKSFERGETYYRDGVHSQSTARRTHDGERPACRET